MNKLSKILMGIIAILLIIIAIMYKKNIESEERKRIEEYQYEQNQEVIRLENKLNNNFEEKLIKDLREEDGVFYFSLDEDSSISLTSTLFRLRTSTLEEEDSVTYIVQYLDEADKVRFEYRYSYIYYPKLAILIDDVGMNTRVAQEFVDLDMVLNYAILPFLPRSKEAGDILREAGHTSILHMPMEGSNKQLNDRTDGLLYENMSREEIYQIFDKSLKDVGFVMGFNNHMGSVFTSNREKMEILLRYAKDKGLYFVDSNTSRDTKGYDLAKELGIPTIKCANFLDNSQNISDIEVQIRRSLDMAKQRGQVLVIGHYHSNMVKALKNMKEEIDKSGVRLVYIEQILE